jgi:hypothetical protein
VIREELRRLRRVRKHHRTLLARLTIALCLTVVADAIGAFAIWGFERHARGTEIHDLGDAFFFTTVQLLTVSSQLKNPLTTGGRVVDVLLELWAIAVVTAVAGSFSSFFHDVDRPRRARAKQRRAAGA